MTGRRGGGKRKANQRKQKQLAETVRSCHVCHGETNESIRCVVCHKITHKRCSVGYNDEGFDANGDRIKVLCHVCSTDHDLPENWIPSGFSPANTTSTQSTPVKKTLLLPEKKPPKTRVVFGKHARCTLLGMIADAIAGSSHVIQRRHFSNNFKKVSNKGCILLAKKFTNEENIGQLEDKSFINFQALEPGEQGKRIQTQIKGLQNLYSKRREFLSAVGGSGYTGGTSFSSLLDNNATFDELPVHIQRQYAKFALECDELEEHDASFWEKMDTAFSARIFEGKHLEDDGGLTTPSDVSSPPPSTMKRKPGSSLQRKHDAIAREAETRAKALEEAARVRSDSHILTLMKRHDALSTEKYKTVMATLLTAGTRRILEEMEATSSDESEVDSLASDH
eukprot:m.43441 g.43441  ORF g.43441 m.43441 type:complete len:394 (+) comp10558_c0_seq6:135-1316(+)